MKLENPSTRTLAPRVSGDLFARHLRCQCENHWTAPHTWVGCNLSPYEIRFETWTGVNLLEHLKVDYLSVYRGMADSSAFGHDQNRTKGHRTKSIDMLTVSVKRSQMFCDMKHGAISKPTTKVGGKPPVSILPHGSSTSM